MWEYRCLDGEYGVAKGMIEDGEEFGFDQESEELDGLGF